MQAIVAHLVAPDRSSWKHVSEVTPFYDVEASWDGSERRRKRSRSILRGVAGAAGTRTCSGPSYLKVGATSTSCATRPTPSCRSGII